MADLTKDSRIVIVGGGKMGEAILGGLLACEQAPADCLDRGSFVVVNPGQSRRAYLSESYGVTCVSDVSQVQSADVVVLAVKPQVMMSVLEGVCANPAFQGGADGPLFVSIAAGLATTRLESGLPRGARLVRTMPNTPLMVNQGATAVCAGSCVGSQDVQLVRSLFACMGKAVVIDEQQMDVICALSGSGPAYVALMVEVLRDAGVSFGLDYDLAQTMALQTVLGTAALIDQSGQTPEQVRLSVCSPGGTTLAALDAMNQQGFARVFQSGVDAAVRRSKELGELC